MIVIGSRYIIKGITGVVMGFAKEKTIIVLWDGKKNHRLKLEGKIIKLPEAPEEASDSMRCYNCNRDKPLDAFDKWKSGKYKKACKECREESATYRKVEK